jgi:preprotein translocase subunit SecD
MREEKKETPIYKDYRVLLLVVALLIAVFAIFSPIGYFSESEGATNVHFGLDIRGGSTILLELNGAVASVEAAPRDIVTFMTAQEFPSGIEIISTSVAADGVAFVTFRTSDPVNQTRLEHMFNTNRVQVSTANNVSQVNITAHTAGFIVAYLTSVYGVEIVPQGNNEFEIRTATTVADLSRVMADVNGRILTDAAGNLLYRDGTTRETREMTIEVLNNKLGGAFGVRDIPIRAIGDRFIQIDFAGVNLADARELVSTPGRFEIRIQTTGNESIHVLYGDAIERVGLVGSDQGAFFVPFTLSEGGARALQQTAISTGATTNPNAHHLIMLLDDEVVYSAPLSQSAASQLSVFPIFSWQAGTGTEEEARNLQIHLRAGALPVNVEIVTAGQVDASLGQGFLRGAILAGILALFAVSVFVYHRYRRPEIVVPMIAITFCEIVLLIGFSVLIMQDLNLAAIAGIIAVIGTGIDHLIIITEEVAHEGKVPSDIVYTKRIGKAFAIIVAAAATTVVAMTPLAVLGHWGFGSLTGFAIVTIAGVLIGALIARPAYSSILRFILIKRGMVDDKAYE